MIALKSAFTFDSEEIRAKKTERMMRGVKESLCMIETENFFLYSVYGPCNYTKGYRLPKDEVGLLLKWSCTNMWIEG